MVLFRGLDKYIRVFTDRVNILVEKGQGRGQCLMALQVVLNLVLIGTLKAEDWCQGFLLIALKGDPHFRFVAVEGLIKIIIRL